MAPVRKLRTPLQLAAEVYVLEGTIATLLDDVEGWRKGGLRNEPVPRDGQLACADHSAELVAELTERLERAKAECRRRSVEPWDPMATPKERR